MKKLRAVTYSEGFTASALQTAGVFLVSVALGAAFWLASLPMALAVTVTPVEMIQSNLPKSMTLVNAPKAVMLSAICKTVTRHRKDAPLIVRTAAGARKEDTADIVGTAIHCLSEDKAGPDCALVRSILQEAIAADGDEAAALTELVVGAAPGCTDIPGEGPEGFVNPPSNINPPPSTGGGPGTNNCTVCHNNKTIQVQCANLDSYLKNHPGDTSGACEATPSTNK
jgi:hypothetical protein